MLAIFEIFAPAKEHAGNYLGKVVWMLQVRISEL